MNTSCAISGRNRILASAARDTMENNNKPIRKKNDREEEYASIRRASDIVLPNLERQINQDETGSPESNGSRTPESQGPREKGTTMDSEMEFPTDLAGGDIIRYFWLATNPDLWAIDSIKDGQLVFFSSVNKRGHKRRIYGNFLLARPGDKVLFYETAPSNKVVAIGEVMRGMYPEYDEGLKKKVEGIVLKFKQDVSCVLWDTIKEVEDLRDSSPVRNMAHGSLFHLSQREYETILSLDEFATCEMPESETLPVSAPPTIDQIKVTPGPLFDPDTEPTIKINDITDRKEDVYEITGEEPYYSVFSKKLGVWKDKDDVFAVLEEDKAKDLRIESLYFEDSKMIIRQVRSALENGKHIILYGPPGTGKSKLAKAICESYGVNYSMVTATIDWSTFDTIGGYVPEKGGNLRFNPGIFLKCLQDGGEPMNRWLIIDEINRAEIDKAFGSLFSALTGDNITLPQKILGHNIEIKGDIKATDRVNPFTYYIHPDWRIIATMNTLDKSSLYEMSYAFMRRFSFIPVGVPTDLDSAFKGLLKIWNLHVDDVTRMNIIRIWQIINEYRKIGPAIIQDILGNVMSGKDYTSAIIIHVLPQLEGLDIRNLREFYERMTTGIGDDIDEDQLRTRMEDFFGIKLK